MVLIIFTILKLITSIPTSLCEKVFERVFSKCSRNKEKNEHDQIKTKQQSNNDKIEMKNKQTTPASLKNDHHNKPTTKEYTTISSVPSTKTDDHLSEKERAPLSAGLI